MYKIGEYIVHATIGVARVEDILTPDFEKDGKRLYYVLAPFLGKEGDRTYSPVDGGRVFTRGIMTPLEAEELISHMPRIAPFEVKNEKQRRDVYKRILSEPYPANLVSVIKTAYVRRVSAIERKRSFPAFEGAYIAEARRILECELSIALSIPYDGVESFLVQRLGRN